jgi:hypothetical protein
MSNIDCQKNRRSTREYARDKNMTESTGLQFIGLALSFQLVIINWSLQRMNDTLDGIQRTLEDKV